MKIEATHVKKRQLHQYLPPELVQRKKRVSCVPLLAGTKTFKYMSKRSSVSHVRLFSFCVEHS